MRALWSDKQNCSHNVSQNFKLIRRFAEIGPEKKTISKKHISNFFTGLSQDYPRIVPGLSRHFPEISWQFCLCVSCFAQEKATHEHI